MLDFGVLPPEVNSGRMYSGPGAGPMLAAATAWDGLASELTWASSCYGSVISGLTGAQWMGPTSTTMAAAVTPYVTWLSATAAQAQQTAAQARAAAGAYEAAFAATVPPPAIAANRAQLTSLIATNFFGQNAPAIAATEAQYAEMWAQDAAAMYGYAGNSATASAVAPFTTPPPTANPAGSAEQAAAVANAAGTQAHSTASTLSQLVSSSALTQALQSSVTSSSTSTTVPTWLQQLADALTVSNKTALVRTAGLSYQQLGILGFFVSIATTLIPGTPASGDSVLDYWGPPAAGLGHGALVSTAPNPLGPDLPFGHHHALHAHTLKASLSARMGHAGTIGQLSVPPEWATGEPEFDEADPLRLMSPHGANAAGGAGPQALLRGIPLTGTGQRNAGFIHRYGFRYTVMARPPSAG